eukprot:Rmarinus@m.9204
MAFVGFCPGGVAFNSRRKLRKNSIRHVVIRKRTFAPSRAPVIHHAYWLRSASDAQSGPTEAIEPQLEEERRKKTQTALIWFTDDLRTDDNELLLRATPFSRVIPIYFWDQTVTSQVSSTSLSHFSSFLFSISWVWQ